jgi:hypothetical protein
VKLTLANDWDINNIDISSAALVFIRAAESKYSPQMKIGLKKNNYTRKQQSPKAEAAAALVFIGADGSLIRVMKTERKSLMTSSPEPEPPSWTHRRTASLAAEK